MLNAFLLKGNVDIILIYSQVHNTRQSNRNTQKRFIFIYLITRASIGHYREPLEIPELVTVVYR